MGDAQAAQAALIIELCYSAHEQVQCLPFWSMLPACELEMLRDYEQSYCFIYSQLITLNSKQSVCFSSVDNYPLVNISLKYLQHLATAQNCYIKMNILSQ